MWKKLYAMFFFLFHSFSLFFNIRRKENRLSKLYKKLAVFFLNLQLQGLNKEKKDDCFF